MKSFLKVLVLALVTFALGADAWKKEACLAATIVHHHKGQAASVARDIRGGGWLPGGYNPFGYKITSLGEEFLAFDDSLNSDVGRFLASLKSRKTKASLKESWVEVVRVAKTGQSIRILRRLNELIAFCLRAGLID